MKSENWQKVEEIFHQALTFERGERQSYLEQTCSHDPLLLNEINSLITSFENDEEFLESPVDSLSLSVIHQKTEKTRTDTTLGFYQIGEKLGSGGMGEVYQAIDTRLNRKVALKFLSDSLKNDNLAKRQLRKEAQAIAMLEHPNICAVYGIEEIEDDSFIVMQFLDGTTLEKSLQTISTSPQSFKSLAKQIVGAVAFAHSHGVIHRDLKPGNIILTDVGNIKVLDFGLAKVIGQQKFFEKSNAAYSSLVSQNGLVIGTISYMSPEQLRGEKLDYQTDIFSLGIVLYELLAKENPFQHQTQADTIAAILSDSAVSAEKITPKLPTAIVNLINHCLAKDKNNRFQSAAEILVELDKIEGGTVSNSLFTKSKISFATSLLILFSTILLGLGTFYYLSNSLKLNPEITAKSQSLAVLPISVDSTLSEKEFLANGLTISLIDNLSKLSSLKVRNESIVSQFKEKNITPEIVGKELGVDLVFFGKIIKKENGIFLETNLVRISDNFTLDKNEFPLDENRLIELQENITGRIIGKTLTNLTSEEKSKIARKDTENSEAKKLYFNGRFYLNRRQTGDPEKAIKSFRDATNLDPSYAKAWAGLADAYTFLSILGYKGIMAPEETVKLAKAAAKTALDIDDTLCEPYVSLGIIKLRYEWDWQGAETNFKEAINRDPQFSQSYLGLSNLYIAVGRFDEAIEVAQRAKEFSPFSVSADSQLATAYYFKRDYQKMSKLLIESFEKNPNHKRLKYLLGFQLLQTGKIKEATEIFEKIYQDDELLGSAPLGLIYGMTNRIVEAKKILSKLEILAKNNYIPSQERAFIFLGIGDKEKVFESLKNACEEKSPVFPFLINEPAMDEIKSDSRFVEIKKCANL